MFKIALPNPWEMSAEDFFSQMRVVLKATEKSYQEITKGLTEEQKENYFIGFRLPEITSNFTDDEIPKITTFVDRNAFESHLLDDNVTQKIELEISN